LTRLRTTRHLWDGNLYLWDSLQVSVALLVVSVALAWWSRSASLAVLSGIGFVVSMGVVPIAALKHVQANLMMPRYFAAQITFGLLLQSLVVVAMALMVVDRRWPVTRVSGRGTGVVIVAKAAVVAATIVAVFLVAVTPLGFGLNYRDQSGNSKTARPLSSKVVEQLLKIQLETKKPVLINMGFWDAYPSVFVAQQSGLQALVLDTVPSLDSGQYGFDEIIRSRSFIGVCVPRFSSCIPEFGNVVTQRGVSKVLVSEIGRISEDSGRVVAVLDVSPSD